MDVFSFFRFFNVEEEEGREEDEEEEEEEEGREEGDPWMEEVTIPLKRVGEEERRGKRI